MSRYKFHRLGPANELRWNVEVDGTIVGVFERRGKEGRDSTFRVTNNKWEFTGAQMRSIFAKGSGERRAKRHDDSDDTWHSVGG